MIFKNYPFKLVKKEGNIIDFQMVDENAQVKVFVLEDDIIRVLWVEENLKLDKSWLIAPGLDDIEREGRDRLDCSYFSLPNYTCFHENNICVIETSKIKVEFDLNGMKATWYAKTGGKEIEFARDRKTQAYNIKQSLGKGIFHYMERNLDEQYFGLGEKTGKTNRYGKRYRMMCVDPMGYDAELTDPLYKHIPFYITRNTQSGVSFGLFYDNLSTSTFDLGNELDNYHGLYRYYHAEDGDLDYYVILGPKVKEVTKKFSWLTGKTIFSPKWSLGYSGSTMIYTDAPDAQEQLQLFVKKCEAYDIPCDSFQLSSGYTSIGSKRYVFNWNYVKIPAPEKMTESFHKRGVKLCANIKPALLIDHPRFEELKKSKMFVLNREETGPEIAQFWDDLGAYLDFTNPISYDWWKHQIKEKLLEYGIDSTWNDNNEYEIWDNEAKVNGFGKKINISLIRPLQALLMMKASYEAQKEHAPSIRPYLISRSGCPGMQRYVQTWSGDNRTDWKTIKYNIHMGIGLSLSGIYNFGHDVGGFAGPAPEPELFVRWVQNGIFYPRFTIHSWNDDGTVNVPWMYPEVTSIVRELIKFRSRITPYIYNLLYRAYKYHEPIIRPTFYDIEEDSNTFKDNDEFMLGPSLLVASVLEKGQYQRKVYLPQNQTGWYDYHTGLWYKGGQSVLIPAPLNYAPLLIKGGTIIPINDAEISFNTKDRDERGFMLFPHKTSGKSMYKLYEDDGVSVDYLKGIYTVITVKMISNIDVIRVEVSKEGRYELPYSSVRFYLPEGETRKIIVNDKEFKLNNNNVYQIKLI